MALGAEVPGDIDLAGMDDAGPFGILHLTAVAAILPRPRWAARQQTCSIRASPAASPSATHGTSSCRSASEPGTHPKVAFGW
ncbi:hypothetical protein F4554_005070 [Actinopolymorpha rutila]|uniref:Uncharacterized protein n=1 Tax=Actinopolymorpha rutila TaxID=446787 RepID=A0A852ZLE3_9ACTN|nr:hypothetical protein [Actinopolymorpha rutila]